MTLEYNPFGERQIRKLLPEGAPDEVVAALTGIGEAVAAGPAAPTPVDIPLVFDPFLVRGMGYYTGTIFELAHPSVDYSLGGGGRYDGMIGRFLGQDAPAVGFSIGFERIVDLVAEKTDAAAPAVVLVHDRDVAARRAPRAEGGARRRRIAGAARAAHEEPQGAAGARGIRRLHGLRDGRLRGHRGTRSRSSRSRSRGSPRRGGRAPKCSSCYRIVACCCDSTLRATSRCSPRWRRRCGRMPRPGA